MNDFYTCVFLQVYGGDAHFDDAEMWSINSRRGTNLFQVRFYYFRLLLLSTSISFDKTICWTIYAMYFVIWKQNDIYLSI